MYHLCAYQGSLAISAANAPVPAQADGILRIGGSNGFVPQDALMLVAAWASGVTLTNPRLSAPVLAQFNPFLITPYEQGNSVADGLGWARWPFRPFQFRALEEITATASNSSGAAVSQTDIILALSAGPSPIPAGNQLTVQFASTGPAVANAWAPAAYTFTQALPAGKYAMIASELQSTSGIAHRWTFWNQFYRPGMPSTTSLSNHQFPGVYDLSLGLMGTFDNTSPPNLEVYCSAADAAFNGNMRLIKVA